MLNARMSRGSGSADTRAGVEGEPSQRLDPQSPAGVERRSRGIRLGIRGGGHQRELTWLIGSSFARGGMHTTAFRPADDGFMRRPADGCEGTRRPSGRSRRVAPRARPCTGTDQRPRDNPRSRPDARSRQTTPNARAPQPSAVASHPSSRFHPTLRLATLAPGSTMMPACDEARSVLRAREQRACRPAADHAMRALRSRSHDGDTVPSEFARASAIGCSAVSCCNESDRCRRIPILRIQPIAATSLRSLRSLASRPGSGWAAARQPPAWLTDRPASTGEIIRYGPDHAAEDPQPQHRGDRAPHGLSHRLPRRRAQPRYTTTYDLTSRDSLAIELTWLRALHVRQPMMVVVQA